MPLSATEKALVVAMELLRKSLGDNALGVAANTQATERDLRERAQQTADLVDRRAPGDFGKHTSPIPPAPGTRPAGPVETTQVATPSGPVKVKTGDREDKDPGKGGIETAENKAERDRVKASAPRGPGIAQVATAGPIGAALTAVAAKFAAIAGPAAALGAILSSTISGFGVLQTAVKVLASAIAPVLLPATLSLATIFVGLAEVINEHQDQIDRAFEAFANLLPVLDWILDLFSDLADTSDELDRQFIDAATAVAEFAASAYRWAQSANPFTSEEEDEQFIREHFPGAGGRQERDGEGGEGASNRGERNMRDVLQSLRQSIGPKASISSLDQVGRQAQLAAFNADPLEARLMKQQLDALNRIEQKIGGARRRPGRVYDPTVGDGDFGGDKGAGGDF